MIWVCVRAFVWVRVPHWLTYHFSSFKDRFFFIQLWCIDIRYGYLSVASAATADVYLNAFFELLPNTLNANSTKCNFGFGVESIMPYFSFNAIFLQYWNFWIVSEMKNGPVHALHFISSSMQSIDCWFVRSLNLHSIYKHTFFNMSTACSLRFSLSVLVAVVVVVAV